LDASAVSDVYILGRRGPAQAKFTTKELRELGELANADVVVDPAELVLDEASKEVVETNKVVRRNLDALQGWSTRSPQGRPRRIHLRFLLAPVTVHGTERVQAVECERTALNGSGGVTGTGETITLDAQLLLRSVGYRGLALPGVPFDERSGVIPHVRGRVQRDGSVAVGEYVVGWIKRGPTGVIGTNKGDAKETVEVLLDDLATLPRAPQRDPSAITTMLAARGVGLVTWAGWEAIDAAEHALGAAAGRKRIKIADRAALLSAAAEALRDRA
ncbi:MAG: NADP oxidoreductase, partial [Candidatus Dormibacteria bacterium]